MLILKRLITASVLFVFLFVVFFLVVSAVGGAIVGAGAAVQNGARGAQDGSEIGRKAGYEFGRRYGGAILLGSVGLSGVSSLALSFSGVLPWCRKQSQPPKLPPGI